MQCVLYQKELKKVTAHRLTKARFKYVLIFCLCHLSMDIPKSKFEIGQKVLTSTGTEGYICGILYYADSDKWNYAVTSAATSLQGITHDEIWYEEDELSLA